MSQVINTNVLSLNAQRNLNNSQGALAQSLERLSSGLRINSAKDDAAGLAISERFTTQIRGLNQAVRNANDGISFAQTAEGALGTVGDALQRIRELAVQSANDSNSSQDRQALNNEVQQLIAEVNRVSNTTQFNGQNVLNDALNDLVFQVGANQNQTISVSGVDARTSVLGASVAEGAAVTQTSLGSITDGDTVTVQGISVDISGAESVRDLVNIFNEASADTGVTASQATEVSTGALGDFSGTLATADSIILNDVEINFASGMTQDAVIDRINDFSTQTGVTAAADGNGIALSSTSESAIKIEDDGNNLFGGNQTYNAGFVLAADVGTTITVGDGIGTTTAAALGLNGLTTDDRNVASVSVLTREDAGQALNTLDFALQQVSGLRAELGATQVRFESTISNLEISSENLSAARSRIMDADFAAETAELTRAQVLQQAGTSVLSQANAVPQNVLALLQ